MKIGLFTSEFPSKPPFEISASHHWGGLGETVYHLSLRLEELGHDVYVFSSNVSDSVEHSEGQLTVLRFSSHGTFRNGNISLRHIVSPNRYNMNVVHTHGNLPSGVLSGTIYSMIRQTPRVTTIHGDIPTGQGTLVRRVLNKSYTPLVKRMISYSDRITTVSRGFLRESELLEGFKSRVKVVPNGIQSPEQTVHQETARSELGLPQDPFYVLYLGSVIDRKNPDILVDAVIELAEAYPELHAIIAGEGHARDGLREVVRQQGLSSRFRFPGFVPEEQKYLYFSAADLFYIASSAESFGLTQLEAGACSTPAIASTLPCYTERVQHGQNGYLVDANVKSVLSTLTSILDQPDQLESVGERARELAESYRWLEIAREYEEIYQSVLND